MQITEVTRLLRRRSTPTEELFWEIVRGRRFRGLKFYRQQPVYYEEDGRSWIFIADFYCRERSVVVEIDGPVHDRQRDYDMLRTGAMNTLGLRVIRFGNEVVEKDPDGVREKLGEFMELQ